MEILAYLPPIIVAVAILMIALKIPKEDLRVLLTHAMILCGVVGTFGSIAYILQPVLMR